MAINKNFVIKNGLEVNTNVLVAAADEKQVGIGTTRPYYKLHVGGGEGSRGGIGATDLTISGIATIGVAHSDSGAFRVLGISTFQGDIDLLGSAGVSTVRWDASENRLEFKDKASVGFGTGNDLTLWHDGSTSYIKDTVGDLRIAGDKITLELEDGTDVKVIDQFGVNITGVTTSNRLYISGISTFMDDVDFDSQVRFDESEKALTFVDGAAIRVGTGSDFSIFHDGSNTYLRDSGTGNVYLDTNIFQIRNAAGTEIQALFSEDGASSLYYDGTRVIDTTPQGINVSGVTTTNRLRVSGVSTFIDDIDFDSKIRFDESESALTFIDGAAIRVGTGSDFSIMHDGSNTIMRDTGTGGLYLMGSAITITGAAGGSESLANFTDGGSVQLYYDNVEKLSTLSIGATVFGDFIASGVGTFARAYVTGIATFASDVNVQGNLNVTGDITYDEITGRNLNITGITTFGDDVYIADKIIHSGDTNTVIRFPAADTITAETGGSERFRIDSSGHIGIGINPSDVDSIGRALNIASSTGGAIYLQDTDDPTTKFGAISYNGVTAALQIHAHHASSYIDFGTNGTQRLRIDPLGNVSIANSLAVTGIATADRFIGIHTSADGGGVGIASTTGHVGYGITYIDFKGPGVSTVYSSSVTGITTIYFQGGGGSSVGAAGTWQNDGAQGISTAKSVGINTVGVAVTALMGGEKGASSGIGASMQGLYIGNGMLLNDNQLNGNHYIGTAFGGMMAGPVTVNGVLTVDGNYVVV